MAPRRGGGGSGSGSSVACEYCNEPVTLSGYDWKSAYYTGNFVISIICIILLLVCLLFSKYYKQWRSARVTGIFGKFSGFSYLWAVLSLIGFLVLVVVQIGLREAETRVTYSYLILFVFIAALFYASTILLLWVLARFAETGVRTRHRTFGLVIKSVVVLLSLLATAAVGLIITDTAYTLNDVSAIGNAYSAYALPIELTFFLIYLLTVFGIGIVFILTIRVFAGQNAYRFLLAVAIFLVWFSAVLGTATSAIATKNYFNPDRYYYSSSSRYRAQREFVQTASILGNILPTAALVVLLLAARAGRNNAILQPKNEPVYNVA